MKQTEGCCSLSELQLRSVECGREGVLGFRYPKVTCVDKTDTSVAEPVSTLVAFLESKSRIVSDLYKERVESGDITEPVEIDLILKYLFAKFSMLTGFVTKEYKGSIQCSTHIHKATGIPVCTAWIDMIDRVNKVGKQLVYIRDVKGIVQDPERRRQQLEYLNIKIDILVADALDIRVDATD